MLKRIKEERAANIQMRQNEEQQLQEREAFANLPENKHIQDVAIQAGIIAQHAANQRGAAGDRAYRAGLDAIAHTASELVLDRERQHDGKLGSEQSRVVWD